MNNPAQVKHPVFFGCPLDPDERDESIQEKLRLSGTIHPDDPYLEVMRLVHKNLDPSLWEEKGSMEVPPWLSPVPPPGALKDVNLQNFIYFIDQNGCLDFAQALGKFVSDFVFPNIPCFIGVDHSLTGGILSSLVSSYKPDDISFVVLDSHMDGLPSSVMSGAINYDMETNPRSVHDRHDPFLQNRPDSYNASSFIYFLVEEKTIKPQNLYIIGISDYPPKNAFRVKDSRIKSYVDCYTSLKRQGAKLLTKKDLSMGPAVLKNLINRIKTPYVYVSIDMDIGARNAVEGVRYLNHQGLNETQIFKIIGCMRQLLDNGVQLVGMDLVEFNPRRIAVVEGQYSRTYEIAFDIIKKLCFPQ